MRVRLSLVFPLLTSCVLNLKLPADVVITCGPGIACPTGFVCKETIALCVSTDNQDTEGPRLARTAEWSALKAKRGDKVKVSFAANEVLAGAAEVTIDPEGQQLRMEQEGVSSETLSFVYSVTGNEQEKNRMRVLARVYDRAANLGEPVLGELSFDFTMPVAQFDWVKTKNAFKHDDLLTATGTVDADALLKGARLIGSAGNVRALTNVLFRPSPGGVQTIGVIIDLTAESFVDGELVRLEMDVEDDVGNTGTASSTEILMDFSPPKDPVLSVPASVAGTIVSVSLSATNAAEVFIGGSGVQETTNSFKWLPLTLPSNRTIVLNPGAGPRLITATFRDEAGNESAPVEATVELLQDNQGPVITEFTRTSPAITNDQIVRYALTATDNQSVATYLVEEASTPGLIATPYALSGVTGSVGVTGEGLHTLRAWVQDINGLQSASAAITMTIDQTSPVVTAFTVSKLVTNQPVVGVTSLNGADANGVVGFAITNTVVAPSTFAITAPTGATLSEGANTLYPWIMDTATNTSALAPSGLQRSVFYDSQLPSVTSFSLTGPSVSTGSTLPISVSVGDPAPSSGGFGFQVTTTPVPACTPGVTPAGVTTTAGPHTFYAWACDAAGNVSTLGPTGSACVALNAPTAQSTLPVVSSTAVITPIGWTGTTSDCGIAKYLITEAGAPAPTAGTFSATVPPSSYTLQDLTLGTHVLEFHVLDVVNRIASTTKSIVLSDTQARAHAASPALQHQAPVAAVGPSGAFIAWVQGPSGELAGSWLDALGALGATGQVFSSGVSLGRSSLRAAASANGDYAATWVTQPSAGLFESRGRVFHADGVPYAGDFALGGQTTAAPHASTAFVGANAAFVWQQDSLLYGTVIAPTGATIEAPVPFVAVPDGVTPALSADPVSTAFAVAWKEPMKLYALWFAGTFSAPTGGGTVNIVFSSDGAMETPDVSVYNSRAVVTWRKTTGSNPGIYVAVTTIDGSVTLPAQLIETASASVGAPTVSASASSFAVTYAYDDGAGQGLDIRLRRYSYTGTLLSTFVVNDISTTAQRAPSISHGPGTFTLPVWESEANPGIFEIMYKRYVLPP